MSDSGDRLYLGRARVLIRRIEPAAKESREAFDEPHAGAIIRNFKAAGEAVNRLSPELQEQHPDVPWRRIAGLRDILIRDYMGADLDEVWDAAGSDLPQLKETVEAMQEEIEDGSPSDNSP